MDIPVIVYVFPPFFPSMIHSIFVWIVLPQFHFLLLFHTPSDPLEPPAVCLWPMVPWAAHGHLLAGMYGAASGQTAD